MLALLNSVRALGCSTIAKGIFVDELFSGTGCSGLEIYSGSCYNHYMFKYTAHPEILRKYTSIGKNANRPWDEQYHFAVSIMGNPGAYFACGDFWKHYKALEFYSPTRRKEVPLNGVLVSAEFFQETKVG